MFSNTIQKIFIYIVAMLVLVFGFGLGFMVTNYGLGDGKEFLNNPIRSALLTWTMTFGEFNLEWFYESFEEDCASRVFGVILLFFLIVFGTITMVNVFIAVTMSDMERLKRDVHTQKLVNMASFVILLEDSLPRCWVSDIRLEETMVFCAQDICTEECSVGGKYHLKDGHSLMEKLKKIARENREREVRPPGEV